MGCGSLSLAEGSGGLGLAAASSGHIVLCPLCPSAELLATAASVGPQDRCQPVSGSGQHTRAGAGKSRRPSPCPASGCGVWGLHWMRKGLGHRDGRGPRSSEGIAGPEEPGVGGTHFLGQGSPGLRRSASTAVYTYVCTHVQGHVCKDTPGLQGWAVGGVTSGPASNTPPAHTLPPCSGLLYWTH